MEQATAHLLSCRITPFFHAKKECWVGFLPRKKIYLDGIEIRYLKDYQGYNLSLQQKMQLIHPSDPVWYIACVCLREINIYF